MISILNKNDCLTVQITDIGTEGDGIAKVDGYTLFVKNGVTGDTLKVKIIKANTSYGYAKIEEIITPSEMRRIPVCKISSRCGGCQLMHIDYDCQLSLKANTVINNLYKIGKYNPSSYKFDGIIGAENEYNYRNKSQFPVGTQNGQAVSGFYASRSHDIVPCDDCKIQKNDINIAVRLVVEFLNENNIKMYNEKTHTGIVRHILVRYADDYSKDLMVVLITNTSEVIHKKDELIKKLSQMKNIKSIIQNINTKKGNVIMGNKNITLFGDDKIIANCNDIKFYISSNSFFQVNLHQMVKLYEMVSDYANLVGNETVFDLYSGVGSISLFLADKARKVVGVEIFADAVENAKENAKLNNISNVEFFEGNCADVVNELLKSGEKADVVVIDPPRKGCDTSLLDLIVKISPQRLVYVSCNSATLARDVNYLRESGYIVNRCGAVDMFPQTSHVETIVLLQRRDM